MVTLFAFLLTLGLLITIHEYGHFLVARLCGVKVLQFSIGFGKSLYKRRFGRDGTEFILAAFPLGGYVRMLDEREAPVAESELSRAFNRQPVWKRMAIVVAGPLANLLLAIALYWVLFMSGVAGLKPILGEVAEGSAASRASMKTGEVVRKIDGTAVTSWQDVRWLILQQSLKASQVEVEAASGTNETHLHQLDLSGLAHDDPEQDILQQLGLSPYQPPMPARVGQLMEDSAAQRGGLQVGDEVISVNDVPVMQWESFVGIVRENPGKALRVKVQREGREQMLLLTPDAVQEDGKTIGRIGAAYRMEQHELDKLLVEIRYAPLPALSHAIGKTWDTSIFSLKMLGSMLTGAVSWKGVSGPVTIASYAGQSAQVGWKAFLTFLALVSISLGVLNLLPIPVLDGGHLMYYMVEILKGSPVSEHAMEIGQKIGLALLGLLMACALYNDINRIITG
jgi:regulator of sigma E protease